MLCLQGECLSHHFQLLFLESGLCLVEVTPHLLVLRLKQIDVLVTGLVIVVQATNTALFLILNDLFFQNFKFQVHEVDLLLQVQDVVIAELVHIRVITHYALVFFVLPMELHLHSGFVTVLNQKCK